ncbi:hypothetical protein [Mycobacteroides abscessus]|uniref:hypothetical protein n=1 Tax=Mycobacteroides abscessus TaxID=36809 RepID=UPI0002E684B1|nr:hypothetical protein [Mycobacteroides abscessus]
MTYRVFNRAGNVAYEPKTLDELEGIAVRHDAHLLDNGMIVDDVTGRVIFTFYVA